MVELLWYSLNFHYRLWLIHASPTILCNEVDILFGFRQKSNGISVIFCQDELVDFEMLKMELIWDLTQLEVPGAFCICFPPLPPKYVMILGNFRIFNPF